MAVINVDVTSNIGRAILAVACAALSSILILAFIDPLIIKVFAWLILGLIPFFIYEQVKSVPKLVLAYEIDRIGLSAKRTSSDGYSETRATGRLLQLSIFRVNPPGDGNMVYSLELLCEQGVIALFSLRSHREIKALGESLSQWLNIPLVPCQEMAFATAITRELLFPRYNPWVQTK